MEFNIAQDIMSYCLSQTQALANEELHRRRQGQKCSDLLAQALQRSLVSCQVGEFIGVEMIRRLCVVSRVHGRSLRKSFATLKRDAPREMYVCGGQTNRKTLSSACRFRVDQNGWESIPDMPTARSFCCAAAVGGKLYVFGGEKDQRAAFAAAECYDPVTEEWERLPPMLTARAGCAAAVADGKIFVCGGLVMAWQVLDAIESFDPIARRWRRMPPMPTPRCGCAATGSPDNILVIGGQLADGAVLDKMECLDLQTLVWSCLAPMPSARSGCSAVAAAGRVYVVGGLGNTGLTIPVVDTFDLRSSVWMQPVAAQISRAGCAVGIAGDCIYVVGGFDANRQDSEKNEAINVRSRDTLEMPALPLPRRLCCGAVIVP